MVYNSSSLLSGEQNLGGINMKATETQRLGIVTEEK